MLDLEQFRKALPDKMKKSVNQELVDKVNLTLSNYANGEMVRDNIIGYAHIMQDGRFKVEDYINAVRYVSFKLMGKTNHDAYMATFPDRYQEFISKGVASKDIASYITAYNKNKLVNLIFEQTIIPSWVLNQEYYQEAINTQVELMRNANSEKVRSDAANSILNHLRPPETQKVQLDIGVKKDSVLDELRQVTMQLVAQQRLSIQSGVVDAKDVAEYRVINAKESSDD